ncbi:MAG TPA: LssY C-terminal domain-containing protein [Bryobacteraceae bacterium]|jgi:hypothetical protein
MKTKIVVLLCLGAGAGAAIIPPGSELQVRLTSEATSEKPSGQAVSGVLIAPVLLNGSPVISAGARLSGKTADAASAKAATDSAPEQAATLRIDFTTITDQAGHSQPLSCVLDAVDNSRETVTQAGLITGVSVSKTYEGMLDQGLAKLSGQFGSLISSVKDALLKDVDPSIDYKAGVELRVKLTKDLNWSAAAEQSTVGAITPRALAALVTTLPFRTVAQKPAKPSDLINVMFIGTQEQVQGAFKEAGWLTSAELSGISRMQTAQAIIEDRGYSEAPMSVLFLDGRPPDMMYQKSTDTFNMRHHIRVWMQPQKFDGEPVWLGSATHDTGITISPVSHNFTHGIDPNIDTERTKVVNDMLLTGHVRAMAMVERPGAPQGITNATGDKVQTDRKLAVLEF